MAELDEMLSADHPNRRPIALVGPPGYGKSRLAIEHAGRHRNSGRLGTWLVWWVDARDRITIESGLHRLAVLRQLVERQARPADAAAAALRYLALRDGWLLIFDDAGPSDQIEPYLPSAGGSVLITSRDLSWRAAAATIDVPPLVLSAGSEPSTPEIIEPRQQMAKELAQLSTAGSWDVITEADHVGMVAKEDVAGQVAPRITALWQGLR